MEREDDMRKYLTLILSLLALMCALCVSAQAEAPEPEQAAGKLYIKTIDEIDILEAQRLAEAQDAQSPVNTENWEAAKRTLKQGIREMQGSIDISQYEIPEASILKFYLEAIFESPELFYVVSACSYTYIPSSSGRIISSVSPCYTVNGSDRVDRLTDEDKQEIRQQQTVLEQKLAEIMQKVRSDCSDLTKAMYLHDYIAVHCEYDSTLTFRDAYRMLINGTGVCQGYMLAYRLLLNRAGVTSSWVQSDSLRHVWSLVQLDGAWYHVDITWDDSTWFAKSGRKYFCISEEKMKSAELRHLEKDDWVYGTDVQADSKKYDNYYWRDLDSPIVAVGENLYYLDGNQIMETNDPEYQGTAKKTIYGQWRGWGCYSGLSSYNGRLVYNTMDKIYSYDPETEQEQVLYALTDEEKQIGDIYGSVVNGNLLQYVLLQRPSRPETIYSIQISPYITVTEGGYAYYLKDGTLHLKRSGTETGSVIAAWYDGSGKLLGMRILNQQELDIPVPGAAKTVKIFAAAKGSYAPLCKAIELRAAG